MELGHRAVQTAVIISIFSTLGSIFVLLRLWTRFVIVRAPGWEDAVLVISWVSQFGVMSTQIRSLTMFDSFVPL